MAEKILRVLHLIGTSQVGGTERFLIDLVSRHNSSGIESRICVLDSPGAVAGEYERVAARVEHLEVTGNPLTAARRWRGVVRSAAPDVIVLYGSRANLLGRVVPSPGGPVPLITALRSTVPDEAGRRLARWFDRLSFARVAACVTNSRAACELLRAGGYPDEQVTYIPPGLEWPGIDADERSAARAALNVADDDLVVLSVANLKPVKRHSLLLETSVRLRALGVRHRLWLVGDGPERQRLQQAARDLHLEDTVVFAGHEADPRQRYAAADVFALTSRWEGTPVSVLEAMAAGLPVVAPRVGDLPALVLDGVTGRLVAHPEPGRFAAALQEALEPDRRRQWGEAARTRSRSFSAEVAADRYAALFRWAAARTPGPAPVFDPQGRPTRIVRVLSRLNVGGPTLHVVLLSEVFNDGGFTTSLISGSVGPNEGDMAYVADERGVPVTFVAELGRSVAPFRDVVALSKLTGLMRSLRPDIVHTHASKAGAIGRLAAVLANLGRRRRRRSVIVHTYHGHTFAGYFRPLPAFVFRMVERMLARLTDAIVVISDSQRDDIVRRFRIAGKTPTHVIPLGLDLRPFFSIAKADAAPARASLGLEPSATGIVAAGRLTAIKNVGMLLRAFAVVARRRPDVRLFIVGDGEEREALAREAESLGIADRVSFKGWQRDMRTVYAACDVVALTSINEGTPVALIEAVAAGCRAVATDVGGVAAVVDPSCGILVKAGTEDAFSEALERAVDGGRLGDVARAGMRKFSIDRLVADLQNLYAELLDRRTGRSKELL